MIKEFDGDFERIKRVKYALLWFYRKAKALVLCL